MPLIQVLVILIIVGVLLWLINFIPMDAKIKQIINILVVIVIVLWLLSLFLPGFLNVGPRVGPRP